MNIFQNINLMLQNQKVFIVSQNQKDLTILRNHFVIISMIYQILKIKEKQLSDTVKNLILQILNFKHQLLASMI